MKRDLIEVTRPMIDQIPDAVGALRASAMLHGNLKGLAAELHISPDHLSKMFSPSLERHFPPNQWNPLMDHARNEIPLNYLLVSRGYPMARDLAGMADELETLRRRVEELERENGQLRGDNRLAMNVFKTVIVKP